MAKGRIITVFAAECRFGLPLAKPYVLQVNAVPAMVTLLRELSPLEFVDPSNSVRINIKGDGKLVETEKPMSLPETDKVFATSMTVAPRAAIEGQDAAGVQKLVAKGRPLAVFDPLTDAVSVRNLLSTEVCIAVEAKEKEWKRLGSGTLDTRHVEVWDEFVRTYHMVTADVRPPYWADGHRLIVVKQGWHPYSAEEAGQQEARRVAGPIGELRIDRHQVSFNYAQEGTFAFDQAEADSVLRRYFSEGRPVPLGRETLSGALRAADVFRSGKTAVIESTIAIEVAVGEVLRTEKLNRGVSRNKLDEYRREVGLAYQLNVELPMVLDAITADERRAIGEADAVRKRRNEVVHQGARPTREEGQRAVKAARTLLDMLRKRGHLV